MSALLQGFTSPEWTMLVKALLHTLWLGGITAMLLAATFRFCANPVIRYRCSLVALAAVMVAGLTAWSTLERPHEKPITASSSEAQAAFEHTPSEITGNGDTPTVVIATTAPNPPPPAPSPWTAWLALIWIAGAAVMLLRAGAQVAGAERLRRSCRPLNDPWITALMQEARQAIRVTRQIRVAVTDTLTSPAVVGVLVPTLILPLSLITTLSHEQIRFILLHELAHIRRGDYLANLFQLFAEALLFFNPAVWWISHQIRREREACCDALAIELSGAPADYARTLVHVAERALNPVGAAPAFGNKRESSSLADRIQRLLVPGYRPALRLTWRAMLASLFLGSLLLVLSAVGTRVTMAAAVKLLTPQERIERIEQKMTEYGNQPVVQSNTNHITVRADVRTADGSRLPKINHFIIHSINSGSSGFYSAWVAPDGRATNSVPAGMIWVEARVDQFAPAIAGPFDGTKTNWVDAGQLVLDRGFSITIRAINSETRAPIPNGALRASFILQDTGHHIQGTTNMQFDAAGEVILPRCIDQPLVITVNAAGYEILDQRFEHLSAGQVLELKLIEGLPLIGAVVDKTTGQGIPEATLRVIHEKGQKESHYQWTDNTRILARTDAQGRFTIGQLRQGTRYWIGVSAPGHESVIVENVVPGSGDLLVKLGPELIVRGRVLGDLAGLQRSQQAPSLYRSWSEIVENSSYGEGEWLRLQVTNEIATFQFTNRIAGLIRLTGGGSTFRREITAPVADWVIDLNETRKVEAQPLPKREVIFRFKHPSGVPPLGTVSISVPEDRDPDDPRSRMEEKEITNGEVKVEIPIGYRTSIEPKRMVGYWFSRFSPGNLHSIEVTNGTGPMLIEIPTIAAGAIYAQARNPDGNPARNIYFSVVELTPSPQRGSHGSLDGGVNSTTTKWVSGPLPLGGTYQVVGWKDNSFCVSQPVTLTEAKPDAEVSLQFAPGKTLEGVVLDAVGNPVRNVELNPSFTLAGNRGFGLKALFTDEHGRFRLENAMPELGEYSVEPHASGLMAERVKLKADSQPQLIRLQRGRRLAGRVVEAGTGYAIRGVEIRAFDHDQFELPMVKTSTDQDGRFEFTSLGDRNYTFYAESSQVIGDQKFRADGSTNLLLQVKLHEGSKVKPKAPAAVPSGGSASNNSEAGQSATPQSGDDPGAVYNSELPTSAPRFRIRSNSRNSPPPLATAASSLSPVESSTQVLRDSKGQPVEFTADSMNFDLETGILIASNNVVLKHTNIVIRADSATLNRESGP
jgi:beta-lactamase regulating signal transducer with metallopeptidase domain